MRRYLHLTKECYECGEMMARPAGGSPSAFRKRKYCETCRPFFQHRGVKQPMSYASIGLLMGLTRQRIQQIEQEALRKLAGKREMWMLLELMHMKEQLRRKPNSPCTVRVDEIEGSSVQA